MSSQNRALILLSPGSRGQLYFEQAFRQVGIVSEMLTIDEALELKIDHEHLCQKYKIVIFPGGNSYSSVLGGGRVTAIKIQYALGWNLVRFAERGGMVLGVGTGFQVLLSLRVFGDDYSLRMNETAVDQEKWIQVTPIGSRCLWLRGLGTMELPLNQLDTEFVIDPFAYVEAKGRLERMGLSCLKDEAQEKILGLCDQSGRIFGMLPHPEYFLSWTNMEDWVMNPTRAAAPGQGLAIFENAAKALQG